MTKSPQLTNKHIKPELYHETMISTPKFDSESNYAILI